MSVMRKAGRQPGQHYVSFTTSLRPATIKRLEQEKTAKDMDSLAAVVRAALDDYFRRMDRRQQKST